jgi:hypothetical protein
MIVEYKLDAGPHGMITPYWVKDGGYFQDPDNHTLVGWTPDKPTREFKVPDSVLVLTLETLIARTLDINTRYPQKDIEGNNLSEEEIIEQTTTWYNSK